MTNQCPDTRTTNADGIARLRHYVLMVNTAGIHGDNLITYFTSNQAVMAEVICEIFGGEIYGPGSVADTEAALAGCKGSELRYGIRSLDMWGAAFHTDRPPSAEELAHVLHCMPSQVSGYLARFT